MTMTQPLSKFERPCDNQAASPLMRLPAELRNKIYRNLFVCAEPLEAANPLDVAEPPEAAEAAKAANGGNVESYNGIVELSGQALACCQRLHKEASPLLYEQNTLSILYKWIPDSVECHVLSAQIDLYTFAETPPAGEVGLWSYVQREHKDYPQPATARLLQHYPSLALVRNVQVVIEYCYGIEMFVACKTLQDLLLDKEVVITALASENDPLGVDMQRDLKGCSMFRCRLIKFEMEGEYDMSPLVKVIVSEEPVADLYSPWKEFMDSVRKMQSAYKQGFYHWQFSRGDHLSHLNQALRENDAAKFRVEISIMQAQAIMFVKQRAQEQKETEKAASEARLAEVDSTADVMIDMFNRQRRR
ncbi:hypothetical protein OHC33_004377 [Knufia fluminis]|uniref:Uncharacterized protein n=1 Tax=Knufia fluminis TaxID=191047 RepID=A0AAN8EMF2_9EURO|nr:hypothetical protein OHC33_004377 [Knufia fluminis]